jgi:hypothetical protein
MAGEARRAIWAPVAYAVMIGGGVLFFLLIRQYGDTLTAPPVGPPVSSAPGPGATSNLVAHLLVALAAVMIVGRLLGELFRRVNQPPVSARSCGSCWAVAPRLDRSGRATPSILPANVARSPSTVAQLSVILLHVSGAGRRRTLTLCTGRMRATKSHFARQHRPGYRHAGARRSFCFACPRAT